MNLTDDMLYEAAPEAARRWLDTLPNREDCGHDFSLTFQAAMEPLLRRRKRRRLRTLALLAAVVAALAVLLAFGAAADRPDDYRVYAAQEDGFVTYWARPKDRNISLPFRQLTLGWIPEGFVLDTDRDAYRNHPALFCTCRDDPDRFFYVQQWHNEEQTGLLQGSFILEDVQVDGENAVLIFSPETLMARLLWTKGTDVFLLNAHGVEREDLFRIAENMKW